MAGLHAKRNWVHALALSIALACGVGCADDSSEDGSGNNAASGDGGSGGEPGAGGSGGTPSPCASDCSKIETPQCLVAVCNEGQVAGAVGECVVVFAPNGTRCEDGEFCTMNDECSEGTCTGGPTNDCGMDIPECHAVVCDETSQRCGAEPGNDGARCTPTQKCLVNGSCDAGDCKGAPKDCTFSPLSECNLVICSPVSGECEGVPASSKNGDPCSNSGDLCMAGKTCAAGECIGGYPKDCSPLTSGCTHGLCNEATGICEAVVVGPGEACFDATDQCNVGECSPDGTQCLSKPVANGTACNDYNNCTQTDSCNAGGCAGSAIAGCIVYFQEGFEACPSGWAFAGDWECGMPSVVGPSAAHSGNGAIATQIDGNYSPNQSFTTAVADSPVIDLGIAIEPKLGFWTWVDTQGSSLDGYNLKISTDGGMAYTLVSEVDPPYTLNIGGQAAWGGDQSVFGWQYVVADISAYAGQQIKLRFAFRSSASTEKAGVYIDDISLAEGYAVPLGIQTVSPLIDAYVNQPYTTQLTQVGGSSGAIWSIVGGTNHDWLALDPTTGTLSGTPAAANAGIGEVVVHVEEPALPSNFAEKTFGFSIDELVYLEKFDGTCPAGWTLTGDWECGVPTVVGPAAAYSGTQCLATQLDSNYANGQAWGASTATSPAIDLTGINDAKAKFFAWVHTEGTTYDGFNLKVSTNGGATYTQVTTVIPAYTLTISGQAAWGGDQSLLGWQPYFADLSAFAGQSLLLRFDFRSDPSVPKPGVYIDDFIVSH